MCGCCSLASARASILALAAGSLLTPAVALAAKAPLPSASKPFTYETSGVVGIGADPASVNGPAVLEFQGVSNEDFHPKSGQTVQLGQFVTTPLTTSTGQTTTYNNTPFEVEIQAPEFNKTNTVPVLDSVFPTLGKDLKLKTEIENSLLLKGHLDGTVGPNGQVNVTATIDSIKLGSLDAPTSDHATEYNFPIRFSQLKLPPGWSMLTSSVTLPASSSVSASSTSSAPMIPATSAATVQPAPAAESFTASSAPTVLPAPAAESFTVSPATTPTVTPEPSTIVFFATVLGGLVLGRRRLAAG